MIHSHCYVGDGRYTEMSVPCGYLDEIDEIIKVIDKEYDGNKLLNLVSVETIIEEPSSIEYHIAVSHFGTCTKKIIRAREA